MKRLVRMTAALALAVGLLASPAAAEPPIQVLLQGAQVQFDAEPYIENNRTLVPLRALSERLGFQVGWVDAEQKITLTKGETTLELWIGKLDATVNGKAQTLEVAPVIHGTRTFVPVRFISEHLGAKVFWDGAKRQIRVTPVGASDPDALALLNGTATAAYTRTVTKGEFSVVIAKPGQPSVTIKGTLNLQSAGQESLGELHVTTKMFSTEIPIVQMQTAVRNGLTWMKMPDGPMGQGATQGWQVAGSNAVPGHPSTGPDAGMATISPADLTKFALSVKDQLQVTFGPAEAKDGKQLVRMDVDLSRIDYQKLLGALHSGSLGDLLPIQTVPKLNAQLSLWLEPESKFVRMVTLDATMTGSTGEEMTLNASFTTDPTEATITWPADLPTTPPTVPASGAQPINPPPTTTGNP